MKECLKKIQLANINITHNKRKWFHDKEKKKRKRSRKEFPKILHRTSTHILITPDPIPEPIIPSSQPLEQKWPTGYGKALQQMELVHMISYHTTRKGEAPMSHLGQHGQCQLDGFGYQANWNGLSAYRDVWWGAGLMVPGWQWLSRGVS